MTRGRSGSGARHGGWWSGARSRRCSPLRRWGWPLPAEGDVTQAFWAACHGGQRGAAEALLARGADPSWVGWDGLTPEGAARRSGAVDLADWVSAVQRQH